MFLSGHNAKLGGTSIGGAKSMLSFSELSALHFWVLVDWQYILGEVSECNMQPSIKNCNS